jgi:hypothetical protein
MDKSYVTMEQRRCVVCCTSYATDALLMDTRLRNRFDRYTLTGWGLCPQCTDTMQKGYVALVGIDPNKSSVSHGEPKPDDVFRTGDILWLRTEVWERVFNVPMPPKCVAWVEPQVIVLLKEKIEA